MSTFETPRRQNLADYIGDGLVRTRRLETTLPDVQYCIELTAPDQNPLTGDTQQVIMCMADLDGGHLVDAQAYHVVAGTGTTEIQIHNLTQAVDMLSTPVTIDSGELDSYDATTPRVIDLANDLVVRQDQIAIDVDDVQANAQGLYVVITFGIA
jgi:hypothetical protein